MFALHGPIFFSSWQGSTSLKVAATLTASTECLGCPNTSSLSEESGATLISTESRQLIPSSLGRFLDLLRLKKQDEPDKLQTGGIIRLRASKGAVVHHSSANL